MAVEFALVVPLLVMLLFGIIQFGMLFSQSAAVASAARSGARLGSVNLLAVTTCQGVVDASRAQAGGLGMSGQDVKVTVKRGTDWSTADERCRANANSATASGSPAQAPCVKPAPTAADSATLYVRVEYEKAKVAIPFLPSWDLPQSTTGSYRCEYN